MEGQSLLDKLDAIPQVRAFDAFPKVVPTYLATRSRKGGLFTLCVGIVLAWLTWTELVAYLYGHPASSFGVDHDLAKEMQVNIDLTVAMKCHYLTVDVRDAVGDRLHFSDTEITKDETLFELGHANRLSSIPMPDRPIGDVIDAARHLQFPSFSRKSKPKRKAKGYGNKQVAFKDTEHLVKDGDACRIYGSVLLKKVTGNLHISTLGHGYLSWEHTPHNLMNLSHVIHELSFGPFFPDISQPLDHSVEISQEHFAIFQYFVNIVPTRYIDSRGREIQTSQYSVTDYVKTIQHGQGIPGIFIKFDHEPLALTLHQRTISFTQFLVRLAGILGGVWVCAGFTLRVGDRAAKTAMKVYSGKDEADYPEAFTSAYSSSRKPTRGYSGNGGGGGTYAEIYNSSVSGADYSTVSAADHSIAATAADTSVGSIVGGAYNVAKNTAGQAWQVGSQYLGPKHRKTESLAQKMMSEEGRTW